MSSQLVISQPTYINRWCIFRPTHILYITLLTYLHVVLQLLFSCCRSVKLQVGCTFNSKNFCLIRPTVGRMYTFVGRMVINCICRSDLHFVGRIYTLQVGYMHLLVGCTHLQVAMVINCRSDLHFCRSDICICRSDVHICRSDGYRFQVGFTLLQDGYMHLQVGCTHL